jgi:predicted ATP-grasp superfamily ATP-dependent carboligase
VRVFVFEYTTGGGLLASADTTAGHLHTLAAEGAAMVTALAADFSRLPGAEVGILRDYRIPLATPAGVIVNDVATSDQTWARFDELSAAADHTVVIAPECDGVLLACVERVAQCGGRLLGASAELVRLAADKQATADHLARAGVPVPRGCLLQDFVPSQRSFPRVLKPRDGAGSHGVRLLTDAKDLAEALDLAGISLAGDRWRVEEFCPGLTASVAVLCGPGECLPLAPCAQRLSDDGAFRYLGGSLPLANPLPDRAARLAARTAAALASPLGYLGMDMVLGHRADGDDDVVIEINPRLTTSYIGLRAATRQNLAAAMLAVAAGGSSQFTFDDEPVEFTAAGEVRRADNAPS